MLFSRSRVSHYARTMVEDVPEKRVRRMLIGKNILELSADCTDIYKCNMINFLISFDPADKHCYKAFIKDY